MEELIKGAFDEFAGFYRLDAKKQAGRTRLFFGIQAVFEKNSRLKNQSASIDAGRTACFFLSALGVNKRNRG